MGYRKTKQPIPTRIGQFLSQLTTRDITLWGGFVVAWAMLTLATLQYEGRHADPHEDVYSDLSPGGTIHSPGNASTGGDSRR